MKVPLGEGTPQGIIKLFYAKLKVNTCTVCENACLLKMLEKLQFHVCHCNGVLYRI